MYCRSILLGKSSESYYIDCQQRRFAHVLKHCDNDFTSPELSCVFSSSSRSITGLGEAERLARRSRKAGKPGPKTSYRKVKTSPSRRGHIHNTQLRRCCLLTITFNRDTRRKSLMEKDEESHRHSRQEIV